MDGASHRGIEEVRTLLEGVNRPATRSPYKVYIVDEVHMLTREAFNALLKTLEEPPAHVKFLFATTEPHRIPETVLSRCQRFDFHPIGEDAIVRRLAQILDSEGRSGEEGLLEKVARFGKGGMRDAQTLLDQLMTYSEGTLQVEDLEKITGRVPEASVSGLAEAVLAGDAAGVMTRLRAGFEGGADPSVLLEQMVDAVRGRLHERIHGVADEPPTGPSLDKLLAFLQILVDASSKLKYSPFAEVSVEVVLLKLARLEEPGALEDVLRRLGEIESGAVRAPPVSPKETPGTPPRRNPAAPSGPPGAPRTETPPRDTPPRAEAPPPPVVASAPGGVAPDFRRLESLWDQVQIEVEQKHPSIAPYLKGLRPQPVPGEEGVVRIGLRGEFHLRQMRAEANQQALVDVVRDVTGAPWRIRLQPASGGGARVVVPSPSPGSSASPGGPPPVSGGNQPGGSGTGEIARSPIVKKSLDLFNGRIV
jgi:DNA polymerase-3 subunit gamma/tau